jgi:lipopolysaccharide/colanic/teichoic acid biosynthesis glycosyltransferase
MKRFWDILIGLFLFLPSLIFLIVLSILILVVDRFSPFFPQKRIGKNGKIFTCYKLQTMRPATNQAVIGEREKDGERLTRLGEFIRDHGWDELPQILNVLIGDMSFIGPRPLLPKSFERIREKNPGLENRVMEWEGLRKRFRPGVSGWHQIHIAEHLSILDCDLEYFRLQRDLEYDSSTQKNLKIILISITVFFLGKKRCSRLVNL